MSEEVERSLSLSWMALNGDFAFPQDDEEGARRLAAIRAHWNRATNGMTNRDTWFDDKIIPMYSEPTRYYHTLVHLEEMIGYLGRLDYDVGKDYQTLVLTSLFHDIVYDPKSATNEEDSAMLFEMFWNESAKGDEEVKARVVQYILATKQHTATAEDSCEQLLLDIDMAVLGKQKEAYWKYAALIRREYAFVEHNVYCEKRAEVLQGFLKHPIFGTQAMKDALEEQARQNLKLEIESLQSGVIPGEAQRSIDS